MTPQVGDIIAGAQDLDLEMPVEVLAVDPADPNQLAPNLVDHPYHFVKVLYLADRPADASNPDLWLLGANEYVHIQPQSRGATP